MVTQNIDNGFTQSSQYAVIMSTPATDGITPDPPVQISPDPCYLYNNAIITISSMTAYSNIKIVDENQKTVRELYDENGDGTIIWDVKDSSGLVVSEGIYDCIIISPWGTIKNKTIIIRSPIAPGGARSDYPSNILNNSRIYPNPFKLDSQGSITINNIPANCVTKIYTVSSELVNELNDDNSDGIISWNGKNKEDRTVAAGVYICEITAPDGTRKSKLIAIVK